MSDQIIMYGVGIEPTDIRPGWPLPGTTITDSVTYTMEHQQFYYVIEAGVVKVLDEVQVMEVLDKALKKGKVPKFMDPEVGAELKREDWPSRSILIIRGEAVTPGLKLK